MSARLPEKVLRVLCDPYKPAWRGNGGELYGSYGPSGCTWNMCSGCDHMHTGPSGERLYWHRCLRCKTKNENHHISLDSEEIFRKHWLCGKCFTTKDSTPDTKPSTVKCIVCNTNLGFEHIERIYPRRDAHADKEDEKDEKDEEDEEDEEDKKRKRCEEEKSEKRAKKEAKKSEKKSKKKAKKEAKARKNGFPVNAPFQSNAEYMLWLEAENCRLKVSLDEYAALEGTNFFQNLHM